MKKIWGVLTVVLLFTVTAYANRQYTCGMIKGEWPPRQPRATGTTCRTNVMATSAQEAFNKCNMVDGSKRPCCEENAIHRDIRGLAILDVAANEITHIQCP